MARLQSGELRSLLEQLMPDVLAAPAPRREAETPEPQQGRRGEEEPRPVLQEHDVVVVPERLPDVARYLRDVQGYAYLSHITAVDYLVEDLIEVVYFFYHPEGGGPQIVRVRVPRKGATIPSLSPWWPGANLQEREAFDMFGVSFPGHPYHHRLYMWDEFEGHPLLKDFPKTGDKYTHVTGGEE